MSLWKQGNESSPCGRPGRPDAGVQMLLLMATAQWVPVCTQCQRENLCENVRNSCLQVPRGFSSVLNAGDILAVAVCRTRQDPPHQDRQEGTV